MLFLSTPLINRSGLSFLVTSSIALCCVFFLRESNLVLWVFFELPVLPVLIIVLLYGNQIERLRASYSLLGYSIVRGLSFYLLFSLCLRERGWVSINMRSELLFLITLPFLVKLPGFLFHLWLPLAHVEAPTVGRVILAALLLKLGTLGLFRVSLVSSNLVFIIALLSLLLCPILAIVQRDVKCLVAYSSISHMGLLSLIFWINRYRAQRSGWLLQITHGFVSGLLFYIVGSLSTILGSRALYYSMRSSPLLLFRVAIANRGAPPSLAFLREVLGLFRARIIRRGLVFLVCISMFNTLYYCLYLFISAKKKSNQLGVAPTIIFTIIAANYLLLLFSVSL